MMRIGTKNHKSRCQCFICKAIRGETKDKNHPRYNSDRHTDHYCIECNNEISYLNWKCGSGLCKKCSRKKKRNGRFLDGRTLKKYHCIDCNNKITLYAKRCPSCATKQIIRENGHPNKGRIFQNAGYYGRGDYYKNIWMRSSYELKFAKFLDLSDYKWKYESKTFDLGNTTYTPDFYIPEWDLHIEIKGWWKDDAKKKFKLFKKLYSKVNIKILMKENLEEIGVL